MPTYTQRKGDFNPRTTRIFTIWSISYELLLNDISSLMGPNNIFSKMEDFESSLKDTYPDSFIPGLSQLQANMVSFKILIIPLS